MARMSMAILGAVRINRHPAHGVLDASFRMPASMLRRDVIGMSVVRVSFVNSHGDLTLSPYTLWG